MRSDGRYAGFDTTALTSRDGGKAAAVRAIKEARGYATVAMVGDGATDLQARPPASIFIGYGGVVSRPAVAAGADWFVTDFAPVIEAVQRHGPARVSSAGSIPGGAGRS